MPPPRPRFLTSDWLNLAMLNYEIEPVALARHVPSRVELDAWNRRTFVSVVGFQFFHTRVLGVPIPFHTSFEEVNLRFYVRRKVEGAWRRGTMFVKELVPLRLVAWTARAVYNEPYVGLPMRHAVDASSVRYEWRRDGEWEGLSARFSGQPVLPPEDSEEAFITEHYWGYRGQPDGSTLEYQVEHRRWNVWRATSSELRCDAALLYGPEFAEAFSHEPSTAFVADGSRVIVRRGSRL